VITIGPRGARAFRGIISNATRLRAADALDVWVTAREGVPLVTTDQEVIGERSAADRHLDALSVFAGVTGIRGPGEPRKHFSRLLTEKFSIEYSGKALKTRDVENAENPGAVRNIPRFTRALLFRRMRPMITAATTRDEVIERCTQAEPRIRSLGVRRIALFGSLARGEANADSDVDVLVEFEPPHLGGGYRYRSSRLNIGGTSSPRPTTRPNRPPPSAGSTS
jgi:hypothetical protein